MEQKRNKKDYEVLADLLQAKAELRWVKIWADKLGVYVYPSNEENEIDSSCIISSTAMYYITHFCSQHKLDFFISTSVAHKCAYVLIY